MSLIDTVITGAMTAVALAISVPQFRTLRGPYQVIAAARQVVAAVGAARLRAIARNTRYRVTLAPQDSSYTLEREATPNCFVAEGAQALPAGVLATTTTAVQGGGSRERMRAAARNGKDDGRRATSGR